VKYLVLVLSNPHFAERWEASTTPGARRSAAGTAS
jgi:hypothetical protein